jgi:hypothetical protein
MKRAPLCAALSIVRLWTTIYTAGIPETLRDARRGDRPDLWKTADSESDPMRLSAIHVVARLVAGIPDDLGWRLEQVNAMTRTARVSALVLVPVLWWRSAEGSPRGSRGQPRSQLHRSALCARASCTLRRLRRRRSLLPSTSRPRRCLSTTRKRHTSRLGTCPFPKGSKTCAPCIHQSPSGPE